MDMAEAGTGEAVIQVEGMEAVVIREAGTHPAERHMQELDLEAVTLEAVISVGMLGVVPAFVEISAARCRTAISQLPVTRAATSAVNPVLATSGIITLADTAPLDAYMLVPIM